MFRRRRAASLHLGLAASLIVLSLSAAVTVPRAVAAPTVGASLSATNTSTNSDTKAEPGDTISYTATITNNGVNSPVDDATGVTFTDTPDGNTTLVSGSVESTPIARPDFYNALGNVPITIPDASGILGNDGDPDGDSVTLVSVASTSAMGGTISNTDSGGGFTYDPPAGFHGTDSFTYQINDGNASRTDTGTVFVTVTNMIWFINSAASSSGAVGTYNHPFNSISAFNTINDGTFNTGTKTFHPGTGDTIFICTGGDASGPCTGSPGNYSGNLTMLNNQYLIGQGAGSSIAALTGLSSPANSPSLPNTGKSRPTLTGNLTVVDGNTIDGMNLSPSSGTALTGTGSTSSPPYKNFTIAETPINDTGGQAINLNQYNLSANFKSISASGGSNGIVVQNTTGQFTVSGACSGTTQGSDGTGGTIQNITNDGAKFNNAAGVSLSCMTFGTGTASNQEANNTDSGGTCGIDPNVTSTTNQGCNAAIDILSSSGVTLNRVTVNGAEQNGINANNATNFTMSNSVVQNAGTKTLVQNVDTIESGLVFSNLLGTSSISNSNINNNGAYDTYLWNYSGTLTGLTITGTTFGLTGNGGASGNTGAGGLQMVSDCHSGSCATMTVTMTGSTMDGTWGNQLVAHSQDGTGGGGAPQFNLTLGQSGAGNGNTFKNSNGPGLDLAAKDAAVEKFNITNNTILNEGGNAINVLLGAPSSSAALLGGIISGNTIGSCSGSPCKGVVGSGTHNSGDGIVLNGNGAGHIKASVTNNQIYGINGINGFQVEAGDGSDSIDATATGNIIDVANTTTGGNPVFVESGTLCASSSNCDTSSVCLDFGGAGGLANNIGNSSHNSTLVRLRHREPVQTFQIAGLAGSDGANPATTVNSTISGRNSLNNPFYGSPQATGNVNATNEDSAGVFGTIGSYTGVSSCSAAPTFMMLRSVDTAPAATQAVSAQGMVLSTAAGHIRVTGQAAGLSTVGASVAHALVTASSRAVNGLLAGSTTMRSGVATDANFGAGNTLNIGTLPAGHTVTITFQATVNANINNPAGATQATNSIQVTGNNFSTQTASFNTPLNLLNSQLSVTGPATTPTAFQSTTLTATVTALTGTGNPSGSVTFWDGPANTGTNLGSGTINTATNQASISTTALAGGSHTITAVYGGDTRFNGSNNTLSQSVNGITTTTGVGSSENPANVNDSVTFTATVSQSTDKTSTPTGTVAFKSDGSAITCAAGSNTTLSGSGASATATCIISSLTVGTHSITAFYTPADQSFLSSDNTGSALSQEIDGLPTVTLDAASDSGTAGDNITKVNKPQFDGTTAVKGVNVTVLDGSTTYCTTTSSASTGQWSCGGPSSAATPLTDGVHSITASATQNGGTVVSTPALSVTIDTVIPTMKVTGHSTSAPYTATIGVQDVLSGLANITVKKCTNCTYTVNGGSPLNGPYPDSHNFSPAPTSQVPVVFTKTNNSLSATLSLSATDAAGNLNDPQLISLGRGTGSQVAAVLQNIDSTETQVDVLNSTVGITKLLLTVNGHVLQFPNLVNGQKFTVNIAPFVKAGHSNNITVVGIGPKDSTAMVFIAPPHS